MAQAHPGLRLVVLDAAAGLLQPARRLCVVLSAVMDCQDARAAATAALAPLAPAVGVPLVSAVLGAEFGDADAARLQHIEKMVRELGTAGNKLVRKVGKLADAANKESGAEHKLARKVDELTGEQHQHTKHNTTELPAAVELPPRAEAIEPEMPTVQTEAFRAVLPSTMGFFGARGAHARACAFVLQQVTRAAR